jgi:hypothetical protein
MYFLVFRYVSDTNYFVEHAVIPPAHVGSKLDPLDPPGENAVDTAGERKEGYLAAQDTIHLESK